MSKKEQFFYNIYNNVPTENLKQAIKDGDREKVRQELRNKKPNEYDHIFYNKTTLLHYAVEKGNNNIVKYLLQKGANVNAKDEIGNTPLHKAISLENKDKIITLLQYGADHTIENDLQDSSFDLAFKKQNNNILNLFFISLKPPEPLNQEEFQEDINNELISSIRHLEKVKDCLKKGADANCFNHEPLRLVIENMKSHFDYNIHYFIEELEIAKELIKAGAEVNIKDETFYNLVLSSTNQVETFKFLIQNGANPDFNLDLTLYKNAIDYVNKKISEQKLKEELINIISQVNTNSTNINLDNEIKDAIQKELEKEKFNKINSKLGEAICELDYEKVKNFIEIEKVDLNPSIGDRDKPLYKALSMLHSIKNEDEENKLYQITEYLLKKGANPNLHYKLTNAFYMCLGYDKCNLKFLKLLVKYNANPNFNNKSEGFLEHIKEYYATQPTLKDNILNIFEPKKSFFESVGDKIINKIKSVTAISAIKELEGNYKNKFVNSLKKGIKEDVEPLTNDEKLDLSKIISTFDPSDQVSISKLIGEESLNSFLGIE